MAREPQINPNSNAECATGMAVARSAPSSRSWHERDDAAERFSMICNKMKVRSTPLDCWLMRATLNEKRTRSQSCHLSDDA